MNLTQWARSQGIHPQTAYRWFRNGTLPVPAIRVKQRTILISPASPQSSSPQALGLYARVSSHDRCEDLDRQVARLSESAARAGVRVARVKSEVGSGMNGSRPKLRRMLSDRAVKGPSKSRLRVRCFRAESGCCGLAHGR